MRALIMLLQLHSSRATPSFLLLSLVSRLPLRTQERSLEPCVPPVTRRFSTVTRPPPADTRELAGALCAVSPRSPAHLRQIRESSLEPSVVSPWSPIHLRRIRESWSPVQPATKQHLPVTGEDGRFRNHPVYLAHYVAMLLSVWFMSCSNLVYDRNSSI